jgi:hypothetical protein
MRVVTGGFETGRSTKGPLCAKSGRIDLTCHWIRRARFRRWPGHNCIPTRRDKTYPPIAFQPDHACGIYRETQESRYAFAVFKSAVSKPGAAKLVPATPQNMKKPAPEASFFTDIAIKACLTRNIRSPRNGTSVPGIGVLQG